MKATIPEWLIKCRVNHRDNDLISNSAIPIGAFIVKHKRYGELMIISGMGLNWDHISISIIQKGRKRKLPSWDVMCYVKDLFFEPEETVIQYHPPVSRYVNVHPGVLHLWRPQETDIPLPPIECV